MCRETITELKFGYLKPTGLLLRYRYIQFASSGLLLLSNSYYQILTIKCGKLLSRMELATLFVAKFLSR